MRRQSILFAAMCLAALSQAQDPDLPKDAARFAAKWCVSCHRGEKPAGGCDLSGASDGLAIPDAALAKAAGRLRKGTMPPKKAPQPPKDEVAGLLARIDTRLDDRPGAARRPGPGRVALRRLSKYEYRCSIRDLFGIEAPADEFPVDDVGYGFDNVADVLT